jgi:GTPase SAR1 family protein
MTQDELLALIDQAASESWEKLDLSSKGLESFPLEIAILSNLTELDLSINQIREIPEAIAKLSNLRKLYLNHNQIAEIPEAIAKLSNLTELNLGSNQIGEIPEAIAQLSNLKILVLQNNQIGEIPEAIAKLSNLTRFFLGSNQIGEIPKAIAKLSRLEYLDLDNNQIRKIPEAIAQLSNLKYIVLKNNQIGEIPEAIAKLSKLQLLSLDGNPLNPVLQSAYDSGLGDLKAYLQSLADPSQVETLYEAKLVLIGEGKVGKTTLKKALIGSDPQEGEPTTHGITIDIQSLRLPHPDKNTEIALNIWDFGGQDDYKVTHQFFFSPRSLYLILWEPRRGVQNCQVEDWLKILSLRVGAGARAIIISTHCRTGERIAKIDKTILLREYGSIIVDFLEVDSLVDDPETHEKVGVALLKQRIAQTVKDFDQMGTRFNKAWQQARNTLLALPTPRISYPEFAQICESKSLNAIATQTLASLMHDLGYIIYHRDDNNLQNEVILHPEWLAKAIGFVLEDPTIAKMDGILPDDRLKAVWLDHSFANEPRYQPELYPFFLRLMEKYDVSYRLENGTASLIAQHVPQVRPDLPWLPEEEPNRDRRRLATICVLEESPPGLIPWIIVRTHDYIHQDDQNHRLHWQKGMFLRYGEYGEALIELRDRELHIYTEAAWPVYFNTILIQTVKTLIADKWPGLKDRYHFDVPCPTASNPSPCSGRFRIDSLLKFLAKGTRIFPCQTCCEVHDIPKLLDGFGEGTPQEQLTRIEQKIDRGFDNNQADFKKLQSHIANNFFSTLTAIADEGKHWLRLFTLRPIDSNWLDLNLTQLNYRLHLWCEHEDCPHPVRKPNQGIYEFEESREWLVRIAPYANFALRILKTFIPIATPAANLAFGDDVIKNLNLQNQFDIAKEETDHLLADKLTLSGADGLVSSIGQAERSGILALHAFLKKHDPDKQNLGLRPIPTYTGEYRWLCDEHFQEAQSKIPDRFD